ncbi:hypothetical protein [Shewanella sp. FJAT-52076]|uniref:hypothetical protein n=1 Tax=Shewanella sp. FJAT-52076 TaxID=2864202 RepID=UPI001C657772|nr:hypothetical protein [Shewanella sp. FJAT-52076]QYJ74609.1 hypothetical protein K0H79_14795 [Shewanella sp. FJAT-52076]
MDSLDIDYKPSPALNALSQTEEGRALWKYLCSPESLIRMETATYLRKPALEPFSPHLRNRFDFFRSEVTEKQLFDRYKQLAGSMARQIMEALGYEHEKDGVNVITGEVFKTASRYKKPE